MGNLGIISFFVLGPKDDLNKKINKLKYDAESLNPNHEAKVTILNTTTDGCAPGCTSYSYKIELIRDEDKE